MHSHIIGAKRFEGILQIGRCLCPAGGGGGLQEGEGVREGWMGGWRVKGLDSGGWGGGGGLREAASVVGNSPPGKSLRVS